jgi:hypothetical protein
MICWSCGPNRPRPLPPWPRPTYTTCEIVNRSLAIRCVLLLELIPLVINNISHLRDFASGSIPERSFASSKASHYRHLRQSDLALGAYQCSHLGSPPKPSPSSAWQQVIPTSHTSQPAPRCRASAVAAVLQEWARSPNEGAWPTWLRTKAP